MTVYTYIPFEDTRTDVNFVRFLFKQSMAINKTIEKYFDKTTFDDYGDFEDDIFNYVWHEVVEHNQLNNLASGVVYVKAIEIIDQYINQYLEKFDNLKTFEVTLTSVRKIKTTVYANSKAEADEIIKQSYDNGEIDFDDNDSIEEDWEITQVSL